MCSLRFENIFAYYRRCSLRFDIEENTIIEAFVGLRFASVAISFRFPHTKKHSLA
jgi:hypothetical protein